MSLFWKWGSYLEICKVIVNQFVCVFSSSWNSRGKISISLSIFSKKMFSKMTNIVQPIFSKNLKITSTCLHAVNLKKKITKLYMEQSIQGWSRSKTCGRQPLKNFLGPFLNTLFYIFMKCNPGVRLKRNKSLSQKNCVSNLILCIWSKSSKNVFYHRNYFHLNLSVAFRSKFLLSSSERF